MHSTAHFQPLRIESYRLQSFLQSPSVQDASYIGAELDARAYLAEHWGLLKDAHCCTLAAAGQRSGQPADSGAGNQRRRHASNWRNT